MSQNLPVSYFEWIKYTSKFNEDFIKTYNEQSNEEFFLEINVHINFIHINSLKQESNRGLAF